MHISDTNINLYVYFIKRIISIAIISACITDNFKKWMRICSIHIRDMYRFVSPYMIRYLKECQYYSSSFSAVGSVSLSPISLSCSRTSPCSSSVMGGGTDRLLPLQSHPLSSSVTFNQSIHECAMYTVKKNNKENVTISFPLHNTC